MSHKLLKVAAASAIALGISGVAAAATPGFYLGLQLGQSNANYKARDLGTGVTSSGSTDKKGFAGRIYVGYQFNEYWGGELGYASFADAEMKNINGTGVKGKIEGNAIDLLAKGTLPFDGGFSLFAKAGIASVKGKANRISGVTNRLNETKIRPAFGVGAGYDFTPNLAGDLAWTRYASGGRIESTDLLSLGLAYYFG